MKVLVGNNKLQNPGGSETYTYALVEELVKQGNDVTCVASGYAGIVAKHIQDLGVKIYFQPIHGIYDLALLSHTTSISLAKKVKAVKVQTCHGIYPQLEQPVNGMDAYVAISEEVQKHLTNKGYKSTLIENGVDCERFKPVRELNNKLKVILSLAHGEKVNDVLKSVCAVLNIKLLTQNKFKTPRTTTNVWDIERLINEADLVVSLGRGAYEAMACGRNVLILDDRVYTGEGMIGDGFVDLGNVNQFLENNCSGRYSKIKFGKQAIINVLKRYNKSVGIDLRLFALENLNIKKQVDKYLQLCL